MTQEPQHQTPHRLDMEDAILGAMLMQEAPREIAHDEGLVASDFYRPENALIYEAIRAVDGSSGLVDEYTVAGELQARGVLERCGGKVALITLTQKVPAIANARAYVREVIRTARCRELVAAGHRIATLGYEAQQDTDLEQLINQAGELVAGVEPERHGSGYVAVDEVFGELYDDWTERYTNGGVAGLPSGLVEVDKLLGGFRPGELIIIAARPGMGKTAFAVNVAERLAMNEGAYTAFQSLEMTRAQLATRIVSSLAKINGRRLSQSAPMEDDFPVLLEAMERMQGKAPGRILVDDATTGSPFQLRTKTRRLARRLKRQGKELGLVVVDYLQLMEPSRHKQSNNRNDDVSSITRDLKTMALEMNIPIIALSQLNRGVESRDDKRPRLNDLRESGSIEQDADVVMFLYRDDYYNDASTSPGVAEVIIEKHRNGPRGKALVQWIPTYTRFADLQHQSTVRVPGVPEPPQEQLAV